MIQHLGLLMIVGSWLAGWYVLTKWRNRDFLSISQHAASTVHSRLLFAAVLIGCGAVLYSWMAWWLAPRLGLGILFRAVLGASFLFQVLTALVPDIAGWRRQLHKMFAWTMAACFLPMAWFLALAPANGPVARWVALGLAGYMVVGWSIVFTEKIRPYFLFFQASYIIAVQLVILAVTYL